MLSSPSSICYYTDSLTQVVEPVAGLVQGPGVELQPDDGEDDDGEEQQQRDVGQRTDGLPDRAHDHLQACKAEPDLKGPVVT